MTLQAYVIRRHRSSEGALSKIKANKSTTTKIKLYIVERLRILLISVSKKDLNKAYNKTIALLGLRIHARLILGKVSERRCL